MMRQSYLGQDDCWLSMVVSSSDPELHHGYWKAASGRTVQLAWARD